jgi:hypothetical protein
VYQPPLSSKTWKTAVNRDRNGARNIALIGFSRMVSDDCNALPPFRRSYNNTNKYVSQKIIRPFYLKSLPTGTACPPNSRSPVWRRWYSQETWRLNLAKVPLSLGHDTRAKFNVANNTNCENFIHFIGKSTILSCDWTDILIR